MLILPRRLASRGSHNRGKREVSPEHGLRRKASQRGGPRWWLWRGGGGGGGGEVVVVVVLLLSCSRSSSSPLESDVDSTAHTGFARKLYSGETRVFPRIQPPPQGQPTRWPEEVVVVGPAAEEEERRETSTTFTAFTRKLNHQGGTP